MKNTPCLIGMPAGVCFSAVQRAPQRRPATAMEAPWGLGVYFMGGSRVPELAALRVYCRRRRVSVVESRPRQCKRKRHRQHGEIGPSGDSTSIYVVYFRIATQLPASVISLWLGPLLD